MIVLGLDTGLATFGYALVELSRDGTITPLRMGVVRTEKDARKNTVLATEDNLRRARVVAGVLEELVSVHRVRMLTAESMSLPRNASASAKIGMAWGIVAALSERYDLPLAQVSPQVLKKAVCPAIKGASKDEIQDALCARFHTTNLRALVAGLPKGMHEHPFDALGTIVACSDGEILRLARRMES